MADQNLTIKAVLDTSGITRGAEQLIKELQRASQEANRVAAGATVPTVDPAVIRSVTEFKRQNEQATVAVRELAAAETQRTRALQTIAQQQAAQDQAMRRSIGLTDEVIARQRALAAAQAATARQGQVAAAQTAANFVAVERSSRTAAVTVNALRGPLTSITAQLTATNPALDSFSSILGSLALGTGTMIAVLGGLAAVAFAYERITRAAREATEAQREAFEQASSRLRSLRDQQQALEAGPGGQTRADIEQAEKQIQQLRAAIDALNSAGIAPALLDRLNDQLSDMVGLLGAGRAELERIEQEAVQTNEDIIRRAAQQVTLARLEGEARNRQQIIINAANKAIQAQRELQGQQETDRLRAIDLEKQFLLQALAIEESARRQREEYEKQVRALAELDRRLKALPFPRDLAVPDRGLPFPNKVNVPPSPFGGAVGDAPRDIAETLQQVRALSSGFSALADQMGETGRVVAAALRAVDPFIDGITQIQRALESATTSARGLALPGGGDVGAIGGFLSITSSLVGIAKSIFDAADEIERARRQFERNIEDWARELGGLTDVQRAFLDARQRFESITGLQNVAGTDAQEFLKNVEDSIRRFGDEIKPEKLRQLNLALDLFRRQVAQATARSAIDDVIAKQKELSGTTKDVADEFRNLTGSLKNVPEIFLFNLRSIRAAGTRDFIPPGRESTTTTQDNSVNIGDVNVTVPVSTDALIGSIAEAVGLVISRNSAGRTTSQVVSDIKAELLARAGAKGAETRALALAWPG